MRRVGFLALLAIVFIPRAARAQGAPLGPEFRVNTFTPNYQGIASVAADPSGNFVVLWNSIGQDGSATGIFGQRYASSGTPLGPEFRVNTYTTGYQGGGPVAVDASGNFVVVWESLYQDGSSFGVFGQRYASTGSPLGPEFRVNTNTLGSQYDTSVAVDASGNFVVVWSGNLDIFGQRYASNGSPLGAEFRVNTYTTNAQLIPRVAADTSGNLVVVWVSDGQDGSAWGIFGQRYSSTGTPLGPEFRVNTYTTSFQGDQSISADASGNFVVVWGAPGQYATEIFGQRYSSDGSPLGSEFRVNTSTTAAQYRPTVATDASGNFVVVWDSDHTGSEEVFGQRYSSTGTPLGPEFRVNTYTTFVQYECSVGADPSGNFVVVWNSLGQDGSGAGTFGQRFAEIIPVGLTGFSVE